jgi:GlpG protein
VRAIGHLEQERDARTFSDFLFVQGIDNQIDPEGNHWAVWVHSDDQIEGAKKLLTEFRANPTDPRFRQAAAPAEKMRERSQAEDDAYRKKVITGRQLFPLLASHGFGLITYALIIASVAVFLFSNLGRDLERISGLFISARGGLQEIRHGELWRLITPIFIHFPTSTFIIAHIFFNMLWLRDLGSMMEARLGSIYFAVFVVVIAAASNLGQYLVTHNPGFGGMSGVNYALIGYVWIRGRFDPAAGLFLDKQSLVLALIWFAACFTGYLGPIANVVHGVGLVMGMAWAFVDSKRR